MISRVSTHVSVDRLARIDYIIDTVGFGEPVFERPSSANANNYEQLTTTGVIVVRAKDTHIVVTAFIASIDKVTAMYKTKRDGQVPNSIYKRVLANRKYLKRQP